MPEYVIGVDGGNSKTDVVVASTSGRVLARRRGAGLDSPLADPAGWRDGLHSLVQDACREAGARPGSTAACAAYYLANVDLPAEHRIARRELGRTGLAELTVVQNDTLAVLRAGASRPWGVAVVSGAGINAVGVHPSGRSAGFLGLGDYSGDSGGGQDIGLLGLGAAVRARDGRGPATVLTASVPGQYGLRRPEDVAMAVHKGTIRYDDLHVLARLVFAAAAAGDQVAAGIVAGFADEVAVMANALIRRLHLTRSDVEVVLGGGTLQTNDGAVRARITAGITALAPRAQVSVLDVAPVFGALVEALGRVGAGQPAVRRIRKALVSGTAGVAPLAPSS
jgi:N-acetylglucosamine kinase-like BadF-type ATPase